MLPIFVQAIVCINLKAERGKCEEARKMIADLLEGAEGTLPLIAWRYLSPQARVLLTPEQEARFEKPNAKK